MIQAKADFATLAARLIARAAAAAEATQLARPGDARRWRRARLLWPQFTKG